MDAMEVEPERSLVDSEIGEQRPSTPDQQLPCVSPDSPDMIDTDEHRAQQQQAQQQPVSNELHQGETLAETQASFGSLQQLQDQVQPLPLQGQQSLSVPEQQATLSLTSGASAGVNVLSANDPLSSFYPCVEIYCPGTLDTEFLPEIDTPEENDLQLMYELLIKCAPGAAQLLLQQEKNDTGNVTTASVTVYNISLHTTLPVLEDTFGKFGPISFIAAIWNKDSTSGQLTG
jgi:hypothetical protein